MSSRIETIAPVTANGRSSLSGDIGLTETSTLQQDTNTGGILFQENIESKSNENSSDSESCDSESELTGKRGKEADADYVANVCESTCKKSLKSSGSRLKVGFVAMEEGDVGVNKKDISRDLSKWSKKGSGSIRYTQPRLSLLGKPINYRMHKRDARYRRLQSRIYNFLERPKVWWAFLYHILICTACVGALVLSTLSTFREFEPEMSLTVMFLEPVLLLWLIVEYTLRIWSSGCRSRFQGWKGRWKFAQRPLCIVDAVVIMSTVLVMIVGGVAAKFPTSTLRGLRFFQILRMVRIDRKAGTWKLLASVVWAHRRELLTTLYIGFLGLLFTSYVVYLVEKDENPDRFGTYADALWWGVVTLCTVGYGDVVPITWAGKLIASFSAVLGIAFFALPAGILGSGFALKVQQQQRQKHLIRRRVPAALLIQSLWRCYAADENSMSIATWKPHMVPCPSPTQERPFKTNASFVSRFSTRRKERGTPSSRETGNTSPHSPMIARHENRKPEPEEEPAHADTLQRSHLSLATGLVDQRVDKIALMKENSVQSFCSKQEHSEEELDVSPKVRDLTETHKKAIRALRKIKYFVSRKKFREALRPYDVKDVIEQYSAGHVDMLGRVKSLQCRLDQILGKSGSKNKDVYESKISLSSRIVKVERQVEDIETKLDLLIDLYKEDRKVLIQVQKALPNVSPDKDQQKPRSILIDKQYTSEPSTPITNKHPSRVMQRNHSDLSSRIRKRVTYKLHSASQSTSPTAAFTEKSFVIPENTFSKGMPDENCNDSSKHTDDMLHGNNPSCHVTIITDRDESDEYNIDSCENDETDGDVFTHESNNSQDGGSCVSQGVLTENKHVTQKLVDDSDTSTKPHYSSVDEMLSEPNDVCSVNSNCIGTSIDASLASELRRYQNCKSSPDRSTSDHVVLMPLGSSQALIADVSEV